MVKARNAVNSPDGRSAKSARVSGVVSGSGAGSSPAAPEPKSTPERRAAFARVQRQAAKRIEIKFLGGKKMTKRDAIIYFGWETCQRFEMDQALFALAVISAWENCDRFKLALLRALRP